MTESKVVSGEGLRPKRTSVVDVVVGDVHSPYSSLCAHPSVRGVSPVSGRAFTV